MYKFSSPLLLFKFLLSGILYLFANSAVATDAATIAAAKKEGSLVLYGCDPPQTPVYVEAFKKLYPEIKVTTYLAGCWQIYNRHVTERTANKQTADVFFFPRGCAFSHARRVFASSLFIA